MRNLAADVVLSEIRSRSSVSPYISDNGAGSKETTCVGIFCGPEHY